MLVVHLHPPLTWRRGQRIYFTLYNTYLGPLEPAPDLQRSSANQNERKSIFEYAQYPLNGLFIERGRASNAQEMPTEPRECKIAFAQPTFCCPLLTDDTYSFILTARVDG